MDKAIEFNNISLKDLVNETKPLILERIKKELQEKMMDQIAYSIEHQIEEEVKVFIKTEIVPEIRKYLNDKKPEIISVATDGAVLITQELINTMVKKAKANLEGYRGTNILKNLME